MFQPIPPGRPLGISGMISSASLSTLAASYAAQSGRIRQHFESTGDGLRVVRERAAQIDALVRSLYDEFFSAGLSKPKDSCLVALGGYGRQELFPYSDIDLLFLSGTSRDRSSRREAVAAMARTLWDLRLRVGHSARTLAECGQLHRDNLEFNVSLLDCRCLAGDQGLFQSLRDDALPHLVGRDGADLVRNLAEMTRQRHAKHGNTVFHLEPNLKEAPGGLRDFHVARWLTLISELEKQGRPVVPESVWPTALREVGARAFEFLSAVRCFLHYHQGRDDNLLTYECQDQAAALGIGHKHGRALPPGDWMRTYFHDARGVDLLTARLLEEAVPARSSLYGLFKDWRSRLSNADFSVIRGRIFPRQPTVVNDLELVLDLFEMVARHGLELSREAERWVEECLRHLRTGAAEFPGLWEHLRRILVLPRAAEALRAMHELGLLTALFPEFSAIDCLVVRDFYHRYTVDEHSLMTIQNLCALRDAARASATGRAPGSENDWSRQFAEILNELERPEVLFLCLLFHDVGKGVPALDHITGSLEAMDAVFERLGLESDDCETIRFLIANHLEMSATLLRRDIFDPETIRAFAEKVGIPERLKMLTLLTYADVKAVNPEALTPWKAEMLWRLYVATSNYLTRSLDDERVRLEAGGLAKAERVLVLLSPAVSAAELAAFLEGFPRRYLGAHTPEGIAAHFQMARRLAPGSVEVALGARERYYELTVLTADRPFLFASITGTLAAWGMNILKADAFANRSGTVLDTFRFVDLHRTLELNPPEVERFKASLVDVLTGKANLETLMRGRVKPQVSPRPKVRIPTQVHVDDASSSHSTLLELITQDRPGLLYQVSSALAELECNIEVALIDTEGQKVIDVFYLTSQAAKLDPAKQDRVREVLLQRLSAAPPLTV